MMNSVTYEKIDDIGLHIRVDGKPKIIYANHIILCAGQLPNQALYLALKDQKNTRVHRIGGALEATELDAKRAIEQGLQLALKL